MSGKKLIILLSVLVFLALISAGIFFVYRFLEGERAEQIHFERDEAELVVANDVHAKLTLFRAGKTIEAAEIIPEFNGERIWLSKGNYFLQSEQNGKSVFYPVPIPGYRQGSEPDGSFSVTIRGVPEIEPPKLFTNSPNFVFIPSGSFLLGDRLNLREPHFVWTPGFFIGSFEVTNAEFRQFLEASDGFKDAENFSQAGREWKSQNQSQASARLSEKDPDYKKFGQNDQPVTQVTWFEAAAFPKWLTKKFGEGKWIYSLPTEAEWEKVARGPDCFDHALGQTLSDAEVNLYNWKKNPLSETAVIGAGGSLTQFRPNRYGVFHLGGNVVEWTQSVFRPYNAEKPYDNDDRNKEETEGARVARGGSWYSASNALMYVSYRDTFQPEVFHHDLGFRIVAHPTF
jgi:formylglycine-generating enzyme required for sulfatase activity